MSAESPSASDVFMRHLAEKFSDVIPHSRALGVRLVQVEPERARARLPLRPEFIGDPQRQLIHTGVVTTLIDNICGLAVSARIGAPSSIATLDLRVDYLRPSLPPADLICEASCYRLTEQIAFVRARVWQDDPEAPVAEALATFMRGARREPGPV